jgi:hypothetical protein
VYAPAAQISVVAAFSFSLPRAVNRQQQEQQQQQQQQQQLQLW